MAVLVEYIDKIARDKNRDVLFVRFEGTKFNDRDYTKYQDRNEFISFLEKNNISYQMCDDFSSENGWKSYRGQLYLDVPFEKEHAQYQLLEEYLENEDGTPKMEGVMFYYLPLEIAMKNAHHDEPGYWEKRG